MPYLGSWKIDDYVNIPANTTKFSTGAAYDASAITYRVYEDETNTEIVTDQNMTKFDSITGFYLNRCQLTAAVGFEKGKCYTVLIQATVDSVAGNATHTFQIEAEVDSNAVSDKTGYTASTVSDKSGYALTTAPPTASENATAVWGAGAKALTDKAGFSLATAPPTASENAAAVWGSTAANFKKILAYLCGNAARADGEGTKTYTYKDTDGETTVLTHVYNGTDRTNS